MHRICPSWHTFGHVENVNFLYTKRTNFMVLNFYGSFLLRLRSRLIFVKVEIIDVCHRRNVVLKVVAIYIHRLVPHVLHNNRQIMFWIYFSLTIGIFGESATHVNNECLIDWCCLQVVLVRYHHSATLNMFIVEEATHTFLYELEHIIESSHTLRTRFGGLMLCTTTLF